MIELLMWSQASLVVAVVGLGAKTWLLQRQLRQVQNVALVAAIHGHVLAEMASEVDPGGVETKLREFGVSLARLEQ